MTHPSYGRSWPQADKTESQTGSQCNHETTFLGNHPYHRVENCEDCGRVHVTQYDVDYDGHTVILDWVTQEEYARGI